MFNKINSAQKGLIQKLSRCWRTLSQNLQLTFRKQNPHIHTNQHIEADTRWPPFSWRHFQMHFHEWKCKNFDYKINNIPAFAGRATSHYLNQWWLVYRCIYGSLGLMSWNNCQCNQFICTECSLIARFMGPTSGFSPSGARNGIFGENKVNTMAADALALPGARAYAAVVLTKWN